MDANQLAQLLFGQSETCRQASDAAETIANQATQYVRLELTKLLDDPTHPLTENQFSAALTSFRKANGKALRAIHGVSNIPDVYRLMLNGIIKSCSDVNELMARKEAEEKANQ